jgi:hypothetical protein
MIDQQIGIHVGMEEQQHQYEQQQHEEQQHEQQQHEQHQHEQHQPAIVLPEQYEQHQPAIVLPEQHEQQQPAIVLPEQHEQHQPAIVLPEQHEQHQPAIVLPEQHEQHQPAIVLPEQHEQQQYPVIVLPEQHEQQQYPVIVQSPSETLEPLQAVPEHMNIQEDEQQQYPVIVPEYIDEEQQQYPVIVPEQQQYPAIVPEQQQYPVIVPEQHQPAAAVVIIDDDDDDDDDNDVMVIDIIQAAVPVPAPAAIMGNQLVEQFGEEFDIVEQQLDDAAVVQVAAELPVQNVFNQGQIVSDEVGQVVIQQAVAAAAAAAAAAASAAAASAAIIVPEVIPPPGIDVSQMPIQVPAIAESSMFSISKQWVPEPDAFVHFLEISNISENKVLNAWNSQAAQVAKSMMDNIMLQQIEKPSGIYVSSQSQNSSLMKEFDVSDYVSVNIDALLQVGNIIPPQVVEWWKGYFKKIYDDFHKVAMACYNRDVMFQEQLKAYAENMRTLLVVTSCNTVNIQVQSAVMQMREIIQTSKDTQNAAVVVVASRTKELAELQQKINGIRLTQQAASIFPTSMFKTYHTVADLLPDGDIWDVMRTAAASELATAAWEDATTISSWSAELLPEVCMGGGYVINHSNIMKIISI